MKAQCSKCGEWFPITKEQDELIQDGIINPVDINLCEECSEIMAEALEYEYNELEN
jgi:hypothetical protein